MPQRTLRLGGKVRLHTHTLGKHNPPRRGGERKGRAEKSDAIFFRGILFVLCFAQPSYEGSV